jgi:type II secretory pathway pseudopilin PulG
VLTAGTAAYGLYWSKMAIYNRWVGLNNNSTIKSIMLQKQEEASILRKASKYRTLTSMESERLMMSKQLTLSDLKQLAADGALSSEQLIKLARTRQITAAQALEVSSLYGLNEAQMAYLRGLQTSGVAMSRWQKLMNTQFITRMRIGIKNLVSSIITLPNVLMAAGAALIYFYTSQKQHRDEIEQANEQTVKNAQDGAKNIQDFLNSNPIGDVLKSNNSGEVAKSLEAYKNQLESSPIDMSTVITNIETIPNATDKLKEMRKALEDLKKAHDDISNSTGNMFVVANEATNGFLNDALSTNLKELNNARSELDTQLSKSGGVTDLNKFISESGNVFPEVVKQLKDMGNAAPNEKMEQLFKIISNNGWGDAFKNELDKSNLSGLSDAYNEYLNYADALKTVQNQFVEFNSNIENQLANSGKNTKNLRQEDILSIKEQAEEYSKSNKITGEALRMFNMNVENTFIKSDRQLKNESESWKVFTDNIKSIAEKKGIDLNKASQRQWLELVNDAKRQCGVLYPWMSNFLQSLISMANNNPIQFVIGIKSQVTGRQPLKGRGKQLAGNFAVSSLLGYDKLSTIQTDKDASDLVKSTYETYQEDMKNAKANRKSTKDIQAKWNQFKEIMSSEMNVDFIIGGEKIGGKKGHVGTGGGTNTDTFLKDMQNRLEQVKKAMDVYKKWKDTGLSESLSIEKMDASGIFAKGTFKNISSENGLNDWYKKTLENLSNAVKKAKYTAERKKYTDSIAELFGEFDQKATKDKFDDMGKQIEKTISDVVKKWDFYKKVKDTTGNEGLAAQLAFGGVLKNKNVLEDIKSRYGQNELAKKSGVSFETFIGMSDSQLDAKGLTSLKKLRDEYISEDDKLKQETVSNLLDLVQKNKDYAQQILDVRIKLAKDLADIEANRSDLTKSGVDVDKLKLTATKKANNEISKINFTKFKEDTDWATIFGDLDKVSNRTLSNMVIKLKEMSMSANMGVDEIKAIQEALKKIEDENLNRNPFKGIENSVSEIKRWKLILDDINSNGVVDAAGNRSYTYKRDDTKRGVTKGQKVTQSQAENGLQEAYNNESKTIDDVVKKLQALNEAFSMVASVFEKFGNNGMSDATGLIGSGLSNAVGMGSSLKEAGGLLGLSGDVTKKLGIYGMAAGAAFGIIGGIAGLHDKKLDRAIEKSKQKVQELQLAYKAIEDGLKYHLGNAANDYFINTSEVQKVKAAQANVERMKSKGKLSIFDLKSLQKSEKILKESAATTKYLDKNDKDNYKNAYNYQRNLYKDTLEQLKQQKSDEEHEKHPDQSKINDKREKAEQRRLRKQLIA